MRLRGEERDQPLRRFELLRSGHHRRREDLVQLDLLRDHARELDARRVHDFADRQKPDVRFSCRDHGRRARAPGVTLTLTLSAMPSRGKTSFLRKMPLVLLGTATSFAFSHHLLEGFDGADVGFGSPRAHRHAERRSRQVHVRSGGDPVRRDQLREAFPGQDDHVGRHAARELRPDGLRPRSLRRAGAGRDLDARRALELRQELLVRAGEAARDQDFHLRRCGERTHQQRAKDDGDRIGCPAPA